MNNTSSKEFFWGGASSAFQAEGAYLTDGKTLSIMDKMNNKSRDGTKHSSDFYHNYKEYIYYMKEAGFTMFRMSIAWARLIPNDDGKINMLAVKYYNNVINELLKNNIQPIITLFHFDTPLYLHRRLGDWSNREMVDEFAKYCEKCFMLFGDRVKYWNTICEQANCITFTGLLGGVPKGKDELEWKWIVNHSFNLAHARAVELGRKLVKDIKLGPAMGFGLAYPKTSKPEDVIASMNFNEIRGFVQYDVYCKGEYSPFIKYYFEKNKIDIHETEEDILLLKKGAPDFLGLNYYQTHCVEACLENENIKFGKYNYLGRKGNITNQQEPGFYRECSNNYLEVNEWDWKIDPIGLRSTLRTLYSRYNLPIMICENGYGDYDKIVDGKIHDAARTKYLSSHIDELQKAKDEGVNIIGYLVWSPFDLMSSSNGFNKRYGLVYVDQNDEGTGSLKCYKKDSYYWYKNYIASSRGKKYENRDF